MLSIILLVNYQNLLVNSNLTVNQSLNSIENVSFCDRFIIQIGSIIYTNFRQYETKICEVGLTCIVNELTLSLREL